MTATVSATETASRTNVLHGSQPTSFKLLLETAYAVEEASQASGVPKSTLHLVRVRASQINGCANCLRMHVREALADGESSDRLALVSAWRETGYFSAEERAALTIAEDVTLIADAHTRATTSSAAYAPLNDAQIAAVQWATIVINAFNRFAIANETEVAP